MTLLYLVSGMQWASMKIIGAPELMEQPEQNIQSTL